VFWLNDSCCLCTYLDGLGGAGAGAVALGVGQSDGREGGEDDGETHLECELEIIGRVDYGKSGECGERKKKGKLEKRKTGF
jgi:hypothetical protein